MKINSAHVKLMFNMGYQFKKIQLREFRHNLTQIKESLLTGQMYEVTEKGNSIGYFVPSNYEISLIKKTEEDKPTLLELFEKLRGKVELKDEVKHFDNVKDAYHFLLDKKYNPDNRKKK